jgi:hypothetical protein
VPSNRPLQRTGASVAALPLAYAAERQYRWTDEMKRFRYRTGVLGAMLLGAWIPATARATTCEASISVTGGAALHPTFSFVAKKGGRPIEVYAITVYLKGDVVCEVATPRLDGFRPYRGDWTYGAVPPGFQAKSCAPLRPRFEYSIRVLGQCMGSSYFRVDPEKPTGSKLHMRVPRRAPSNTVLQTDDHFGRFAPSVARR